MHLWNKHRPYLLSDFIAGATGAVAGAPQAMGFAIIAGVSPVYGLYAAVVSTIVGALTSSSTFMVIGPTNALALVVASTLIGFDQAGQIERLFVLTLLVGIFQLLFGVLRLGILVRFVSNAVMVGFLTGAGVLIILGQLRYLNGTSIDTTTGYLASTLNWIGHIPDSNAQTLLIGIVTILTIVGLHRTRYKNAAVLMAIALTTLVVQLAGWSNVALVRDISPIPSALPAPILPNLSLAPDLLIAALAIAVLGSVQSAAITQSIPEADGTIADITRDFGAQGIANIASSIFQGMPTAGSLSRTAINVGAGARTRLANIFAALFIALTLLIFGNIIERVPLASLAGHLVVAAAGLIQIRSLRLVWRVNLSGRLPMIVTFVSTLVLPLEYSIYLGILLSLGLYVYTSAGNIHVARIVPDDNGQFREAPVPEHLPDGQPIVFSISGNLYFAAIKRMEELLPSPAGTKNPVVILRLRDNEYLGSTGMRFLERYQQQLQQRGGKLILAGISPHIREQLERTGELELIGEENIFFSDDLIFSATHRALSFAKSWLDGQRSQ